MKYSLEDIKSMNSECDQEEDSESADGSVNNAPAGNEVCQIIPDEHCHEDKCRPVDTTTGEMSLTSETINRHDSAGCSKAADEAVTGNDGTPSTTGGKNPVIELANAGFTQEPASPSEHQLGMNSEDDDGETGSVPGEQIPDNERNESTGLFQKSEDVFLAAMVLLFFFVVGMFCLPGFRFIGMSLQMWSTTIFTIILLKHFRKSLSKPAKAGSIFFIAVGFILFGAQTYFWVTEHSFKLFSLTNDAAETNTVRAGRLEWTYPDGWYLPSQQPYQDGFVVSSGDGLVFIGGHGELDEPPSDHDSFFRKAIKNPSKAAGIKFLSGTVKPDLAYVQKKSYANWLWYRCFADIDNMYGEGTGFIEVVFSGKEYYLAEILCPDPSDETLSLMQHVLDSKKVEFNVVGLEQNCTTETIDLSGQSSNKEEAEPKDVTTTGTDATAEPQATTTTGSNAVADYCDKMQGLYNTLMECIDDTRDAEASGDVSAAQEAKDRSDDAYFEVLNSSAPAEAKDVDIKMRSAAASMNLLAAFYNDATKAKSEGDYDRYQEDLGEIRTVIDEVNHDVSELGAALQRLTDSYR